MDGVAGTTANGRVTNVVVDGYQSEGFVATGPFGVSPSSVTFADNVITLWGFKPRFRPQILISCDAN